MENYYDGNYVDTEKEFDEKMKTYFRPYMTSSGAFNWEAVLDFVKCNAKQLLFKGETKYLVLFYEFFKQLLSNFECYNALHMTKLLEFYYDLRTYKEQMKSFTWPTYLQKLSKAAEETAEHLRHTNNNFDLCFDDGARFQKILQTGDIILMKILVKNGLFFLPTGWFKTIQEDLSSTFFQGTLGLAQEHFGFNISQESKARSFLNLYYSRFYTSRRSKVRRPALITMAMIAVVIKSECDTFCRSYVECFRLFYSTISEPFVTLGEMEEVFTIIFQGQETGNLVQRILEKLRAIYPESDRPYEPRSLFHLCRVRIRLDAIKRGKTVPGALLHLNIPANVKKIILADDE